MCKRNEQSVDHLFLHCEVTCTLWNAFFSRFQLSWVMPSSVADLFAAWWIGGKTRSAVVWKIVPSCLLWGLWREINDISFKDRERSLAELESFFIFTVFTWMAAFVAPWELSFHNFLVLFSPSTC
jgi:hypothetical protein